MSSFDVTFCQRVKEYQEIKRKKLLLDNQSPQVLPLKQTF